MEAESVIDRHLLSKGQDARQAGSPQEWFSQNEITKDIENLAPPT